MAPYVTPFSIAYKELDGYVVQRKELHWSGVIRRPVDCFNALYRVSPAMIIKALSIFDELHKREPQNKWKRLYRPYIAGLDAIYNNTDTDPLQAINDLYKLYQKANNEMSAALSEALHTMGDLRRHRTANHQHTIIQAIHEHLGNIQVWRLDIKEFYAAWMREVARHQTVYSAFINYLHGSEVPYSLVPDQSLTEYYQELHSDESRSDYEHGLIALILADVQRIEASGTLLDTLEDVFDNWSKVINHANDVVMVAKQAQTSAAEEDAQYFALAGHYYSDALYKVQHLKIRR